MAEIVVNFERLSKMLFERSLQNIEFINDEYGNKIIINDIDVEAICDKYDLEKDLMTISSLYEFEENNLIAHNSIEVDDYILLSLYINLYQHKKIKDKIKVKYTYLRPDLLKYLTNDSVIYKPITETYTLSTPGQIVYYAKKFE